jgi:triosephosphate isomerase
MSKKIVAGNWKMHLTRAEAVKLATEVVSLAKAELPADVSLVLCVPYVHLDAVKAALPAGQRILLGAQDCSQHAQGAYTGEVSAPMLASYGVDCVILGHSERRQYFGESDALLAAKTNQALANGLQVIFCCGETLQERESGRLEEVVATQLRDGLFHLPAEQLGEVVIAYEPVWAIGTGVTASSAQAQEMHAFIRGLVRQQYGEQAAADITILYGGSCKPSNAQELFACPDVDGGLIGGASLKARDFLDIATAY